jgi:hypothetical protein
MKTTTVMAATFVVAMSGCVGGSSSGAQPILELIEVQSHGTHFSVKSTVQLEAYGLFSDGAKVRLSPTVTWSSSDPSIVDVNEAGVARLVQPGQARLKAQVDGSEGETSIVVTSATVRSLELFPTDLFEAPRGLAPQLRVVANFSDGTRRDVTAEASWLSPDFGTVPLAEKGIFRLDAQGDVTLVARFGGTEARKTLRVLPPAVIGLRIEPINTLLRPGQATQPSVLATFTDGSSRDVILDARISSLDSHIARIVGRDVVAIAPGRARIVAEYEGFSSSRAVAVSALQLVGIRGSPPRASVPAGRTIRFELFAAFDDGTVLDVSDSAQWLSSDEQIASVALDGTVTARAAGLVQVSASYGGEKVDFTVTVEAPTLDSVNVTLPQTRLLVGQQASFAVFGRFSDGSTLSLLPVAVFRTSPSVSVAVGADVATIEGLSEGPATVEIETQGIIRVVQLTVSSETIERLTIVHAVSERGGAQRSLRAFATYSDGVVLDVTELCTWSASEGAEVSNAPGSRGTFTQLRADTTISATVSGHRAEFSPES